MCLNRVLVLKNSQFPRALLSFELPLSKTSLDLSSLSAQRLKGNSSASSKPFFDYWLVSAQRRGRTNVFFYIEEEVSKTAVGRSPFLAPPWPHKSVTSMTQPAPVSICSKQEDQCVDRRFADFERGFCGLVYGFWLLQWWKKNHQEEKCFLLLTFSLAPTNAFEYKKKKPTQATVSASWVDHVTYALGSVSRRGMQGANLEWLQSRRARFARSCSLLTLPFLPLPLSKG